MPDNYFRKLGFDPQRLQDHLQLYQLDGVDSKTAARFSRLIKNQLGQITEDFFQGLQNNRETNAIFDQGINSEALKGAFSNYLLELGVNFDQQEYFESRLRLGMVHIWAGVNLTQYQSAYLLLQQLLISSIKSDTPDREQLVAYVLKITHLDMSLAIMSYHNVQTRNLEEQIQTEKEQVSSLKYQQQVDTLTQVLRRDAIMELLENKLKKRRKSDQDFFIIMADIDHFKNINDQYGHLAGDVVLNEVAQRLQSSLRQDDFIGRYGGEEFLLILNNNDLAETKNICERILNDISDKAVIAEKVSINVAISLGLTRAKADDDSHRIISRADNALYAAKQNGRNRCEIEL
ncbi:MAG: diguanylate cyclase [Gammaproteobacteria bacterium]|nr:diguanylate cyclase [Gammaproteobacteria bacterium]